MAVRVENRPVAYESPKTNTVYAAMAPSGDTRARLAIPAISRVHRAFSALSHRVTAVAGYARFVRQIPEPAAKWILSQDSADSSIAGGAPRCVVARIRCPNAGPGPVYLKRTCKRGPPAVGH